MVESAAVSLITYQSASLKKKKWMPFLKYDTPGSLRK